MPITSRMMVTGFLVVAVLGAATPNVGAQTGTPPAVTPPGADPHHPAAPTSIPAPTPPPQAPTPRAAQSGASGMPSQMMGGGMGRMMGMMETMTPSSIDEHIGKLKSDLRITDAQSGAWAKFADALRSSAKSMMDAGAPMMKQDAPATLPARMTLHEKMLTTHLAALKTIKAALDPLYASFSNEQKKQADQSMLHPMHQM